MPAQQIVRLCNGCRRLLQKNLCIVSRGQTAMFLQGVITFSISARKIFLRGLILKAITPCKNIAVWPRETNLCTPLTVGSGADLDFLKGGGAQPDLSSLLM